MAQQQASGLINARELGRLLGKHRETILSWARDGLIPCYRATARTIMFNEHEVREKLRERGMVK